jgi:hypothetical protein
MIQEAGKARTVIGLLVSMPNFFKEDCYVQEIDVFSVLGSCAGRRVGESGQGR